MLVNNEQIEHWLSMSETFEVTDGSTLNQLLTYLRSLVVSESNVRFLLLMLSKGLREGNLQYQLSLASFFVAGRYLELNSDLTYLMQSIDNAKIIRQEDLPKVLEVLDHIRYILLIAINSHRLYLPFQPVVQYADVAHTVSDICYRVKYHDHFSITLEKINPWKES